MTSIETVAQRARRKREERIMKLYEQCRPMFNSEWLTYNYVAQRVGVSPRKVQDLVLKSRKEAAQ